MQKPITLSIQFKLPKDRKIASATIQPSGEILFLDDEGKVVTPDHMERTVHYPRPKGAKVQTRNKVVRGHVSVGGLDELAKFASVFIIDVNTRTIHGQRTSAACFICLRFVLNGAGARIECDGKLNIYEFQGIPEGKNPEMLAILKVARDIERSAGTKSLPKIAFVSDSELGSHDEFNARVKPIYGDYFLPLAFELLYASAETGQEAVNRIIKFCNKQSSNYLQYLDKGSVVGAELKSLAEDPAVKYRYMFRDNLEIINPMIEGMTIQPGTSVSLYGIGKPTG